MARPKTLLLSQYAHCPINVKSKQKARFDRIFRKLKTEKKVTYASELFELMLSDMEGKLPVSGKSGSAVLGLHGSEHPHI